MFKKVSSLILCVMLLFSVMSTFAVAADADYPEVNENPTYIGTAVDESAQVLTFEEATKTGTWSSSSLAGGSFYSDSGANASVCYAKIISQSGNYNVHIQNVKYNNNAACTYAKAELSVNGEVYAAIRLDQKAGNNGWYEIGAFDFNVEDEVQILLTNEAGTTTLRASNARFIKNEYEEIDTNPNYIGTESEEMAQLVTFDEAVKTGSWHTSSLSGGSYYSESHSNASVRYSKTIIQSGSYNVQIYSVNNNDAYATDFAKAQLFVNGEAYSAIKLDQKNGNSGWYEIGQFDFDAGDVVDIVLTNEGTGICLRASSVGFVMSPNENPAFIGTAADGMAQLVTFAEATTTGSWSNSGLGGGSKYSSSSNASVSYSKTIAVDGSYNVQIQSIKNNDSYATAYARAALFVNDVPITAIKLDQKEGNTGWYEIGTVDFKAGDVVRILLTNEGTGRYLRAGSVRFVVPTNEAPAFLGTAADETAQLVTFAEATTTGNWSNSGLYGGSKYSTASDASVSYSKTIAENGRFSVQIFSPAQNECTDYAHVKLSINGVPYAAIKLDQKNGSGGWYEISTIDFNAGDVVEIVMSKKGSGLYLRASDSRFVPLTGDVTVFESGNDLLVAYIGDACDDIGTVLYAEYDDNKQMSFVQQYEPRKTVIISRSQSQNKYKLFFWDSLVTMRPVIEAVEKQ